MSISAFEATPFIGRRRELGELRRALASSRCVTLIGIGGVGKTRLAQCLLQQIREGLDGRVWTVDLGQEHDPDMVQLAVAAAMGLRPQPGEQQVETIRKFLGDARAVLGLDNCEHLLDACAALTSDLLSACPGLQVVATSRQALGIAGERVYRVPPLSVPDFSSGTRARDLAEYESVALFVERAHDALPDFELTDENAESVAQLCVALEGIPLAMELAAARTRVLSPEAMLDRLEQRYQLLARGYVDVPNRLRSMEASVEWSHELCNAQEQTALGPALGLLGRLRPRRGGDRLRRRRPSCRRRAGRRLVARREVPGVPGPRRDPPALQAARDDPAVRRGAAGAHRRPAQVGAPAPGLLQQPGGAVPRTLGGAGPTPAGRPDATQPREPPVRPRAHRVHCIGGAHRAADGGDLEDYWFVTGLLSEARHWIEAALARSTGTAVQRATALSIAGYLAGFQMQAEKADQQLAEARGELERSEGGRLQPDEARDRAVAWARLRFAEGVQALNRGDLAAAMGHSRRQHRALQAGGRDARPASGVRRPRRGAQ